jgi:urease accessory protein
MSTCSPTVTIQPGWQAHLSLAFAARAAGSFMTERRHSGPLRVQKPLYPEGAQICHAVIVHPPGGIAGGDALTINVEVGAASHAVLATPGATKWYKSNQRSARQSVTLRVHDNAHLDWLPQNNIVFDEASAELDLTLVIAASASAIGWEATQLGRQAAGERWSAGRLHATTRLMRPDGTLLWTERAILTADDPLRDAPQGLGGWPVFGTLWAIGPARAPQADAALDEQLAALLGFDANLRGGITRLPGGVLMIRAVARHMQALQALLAQCWSVLRPALHGVPAQPLRLWMT